MFVYKVLASIVARSDTLNERGNKGKQNSGTEFF